MLQSVRRHPIIPSHIANKEAPNAENKASNEIHGIIMSIGYNIQV